MIVPIFPESNSLRFVQTLPVQTGLTTFGNRLYSDEAFEGIEDFEPYTQKFAPGDDIFFQFRATHGTITVKVFDKNYTEVLDKTSSLENIYTITSTAVKIYNLLINTSALSGEYYVQIQFTEQGVTPYEFTSEWFSVSDLWITFPKIEWNTSINDGIYYLGSEIFGFRAELSTYKYDAKVKQTTYTTYNNQLINVATTIGRSIKLESDFIPRFIAEKLIWAFAHENCYINGVKYVANDEPKIADTDHVSLFKFSCTVQEYDYANYYKTQTVSQETTDSATVWSFDGSTDTISFDDSTPMKVYDNY